MSLKGSREAPEWTRNQKAPPLYRKYMSMDENVTRDSNKKPEVKFTQRMTSTEEFEISVAISRRVRAHRYFLSTVDVAMTSPEPHVMLNAVQRYETCWLPLVTKYDGGKELEPPLDVHWVWHCHMLAPQQYHRDCVQICERVPDHKPHTPATVHQARFEAKKLWEETYPQEPFEVDLSSQIHMDNHTQYRPKSRYNLLEACERQKAFYYQVSLPHYQDERFVKTAVGRYKQFVRLKKKYPRELVVPTYDIDLIWHTHMLSPLSYKNDTESFLGSLLQHDDTPLDRTPGSKLALADARTRELWMETYGHHLSSPGCLYRGENPQGQLSEFDLADYDQVMAKKCGFRISKIVVKCDKKKDASFEAHFDVMENGHVNLTKDHVVGKSKQPEVGTYSWEPETPTPTGLFQFDMNSLSSYLLRVEITKRGALKGLLPGKDHQEFRIELSEAIHRLSKQIASSNGDENEGHLAQITLDTRKEPCCHLYVHCALSQLNRMDEEVKLQQGVFETVTMPEQVAQLWGPVPLPTLPPGVPNTCRVATHKLVSAQQYRGFTCRVVHSLPLRMSVVQIFQGSRMVAVSHLIGTEQLPTDASERVGHPSFCVVLNTKQGERAMLIKNRRGDWGIVKGHWTGFRKEKLGKGSRRARPGHLKVRFHSLRRGGVADKFHTQSATLFDRNGADTSFKLAGVECDLKQGSITLRGDTDDVPENLALAFSVLMLFMLCEPRDRVTVHSVTKGGYTPGGILSEQTGFHDYLYQTNPRRIMFFLVVGYNEETPSNSHLYLASKEEGRNQDGHVSENVDRDADPEQNFLAGEIVEGPGEEVFCPWESGVGDSGGPGFGELGSSFDASYSASASYSGGVGAGGGDAGGCAGAGCAAGCGAACGAD